jgi:hypothetical protein
VYDKVTGQVYMTDLVKANDKGWAHWDTIKNDSWPKRVDMSVTLSR